MLEQVDHMHRPLFYLTKVHNDCLPIPDKLASHEALKIYFYIFTNENDLVPNPEPSYLAIPNS